jgi:hypothetical protein
MSPHEIVVHAERLLREEEDSHADGRPFAVEIVTALAFNSFWLSLTTGGLMS